MSRQTFEIIEATVAWADRCREMCRHVYEAVYPRPEIGITRDLFSKQLFDSSRIQQYYRDVCTNTDTEKTWLAIDTATQELVGVVKAVRTSEYCEMRCFYVSVERQGEGIGHALYEKVMEFGGELPLQVDVVEYMQDTIAMYQHWGFAIDHSRPAFTYNIVEWPADARQAYQAIYMTKPPANTENH